MKIASSSPGSCRMIRRRANRVDVSTSTQRSADRTNLAEVLRLAGHELERCDLAI